MHCALMLASSVMVWFAVSAFGQTNEMRLTVKNEVLYPLDDRLFGQFLERADKSEPGPEAAWDAVHKCLRADVVAALKAMQIPVLRFPGGSAVEYGRRWTHLVDGAFDRDAAARPADASFGFDEFMTLCAELNAAPLICVSLSSSLMPWQKLTLDESVELAAAEVAYLNAPSPGQLPARLQRWADLRARNGHPQPYGVKLWQVGNEPFWAFVQSVHTNEPGITPDAIGERYVEYLEKHIAAMRAVDPNISVIVETQMEDNQPSIPVIDRIRERLGNQVDWFSLHRYQPWEMKEIRRDGQRVPPSQLDLESYWYAAVSVPDIDAATGLSTFAPPSLGKIRAAGKPLAVTEWNWNGWWRLGPTEVLLPYSLFANGVGAAGYLNAMLRAGDVIKLATQSMLVGGWSIAAVGVKTNDSHYLVCRPTGQVTALYSRYHGAEVVRLEREGQSHFAQPFQLGGIEPAAKVAFVDVVATRTGDRLYLHCINRDFRNVRPVEVRLTGRRLASQELELHRLTGRLHNHPADGEPVDPAVLEDIQIPATLNEAGGFVLRLPPRSVSVYVVPLTPVK